MFKINETLLYAQVSTPEGKPAVVRILEGNYRGPAKAANTIRLKSATSRYPLKVHINDISSDPDIANKILTTKVQALIDSHMTAISQLREGLNNSMKEASIFWEPEKPVRVGMRTKSVEQTVIDTLATLKQDIAAEPLRNGVQARLIAAHQRRASQQASRLQVIRNRNKR